MKRGHSDDFSHAMTDLMAGVAVTFLLLATIFIIQAAQQREAERKKKEDAIAKAKEVIEDEPAKRAMDELRNSLPAGVTPDIDPTDPLQLLILFESKGWFEQGQCIPRRAEREEIKSTVAPVFAKVCEHKRFIRSIVLEGHTDRSPHCPGPGMTERCGAVDPCGYGSLPDTAGFQNNVRLSAARAQEVFFLTSDALRADPARKALIGTCVDPLFVVSGRGPVEPKDRSDWHATVADPKTFEADRRVVLKVRFQSQRSDLTAGISP